MAGLIKIKPIPEMLAKELERDRLCMGLPDWLEEENWNKPLPYSKEQIEVFLEDTSPDKFPEPTTKPTTSRGRYDMIWANTAILFSCP